MKTVQVAIGDAEHSQAISNLLRREGMHSVVVVEEPDLSLDGVIVLDCEHLERIGCETVSTDRFVLITRKDPDKLARIWNAGIRHVVFEDDSPNTVQLAVSAAELRQSRPLPRRLPGEPVGASGARPAGHRHSRLRPQSELPVFSGDVPDRCRACHHSFRFSFTDDF
jgi:hypothetical protein